MNEEDKKDNIKEELIGLINDNNKDEKRDEDKDDINRYNKRNGCSLS
jgi:hypothetical protein